MKTKRLARGRPVGATVDASGVLAPAAEVASLGRRALKRLDKRDRILAAAQELFATRGYAEVSTKEVARRAGIAAGTLFLYADDKQDLLFLVFHDRLQKVVDERLGSVPTAPLFEQLMHVFRGLFDMYGEYPDIAAHFIGAYPVARGRNARAIAGLTFEFLHRIAGLVQEAQVRGEVDRMVDASAAAQNVFSLYYGALVVWASQLVTLDAALDQLLANALALQFRGLAPRAP